MKLREPNSMTLHPAKHDATVPDTFMLVRAATSLQTRGYT